MTDRKTTPRANAVRCDEDAPPPAEQQPLPEDMEGASPEDMSPAQWAYERVILYIRNFEEQLDSGQEVALGLAGGDVGVLRIEGIGYFDPDIITFYGTDPNGNRTQLIQHVNQLNVMLRAEPIADPEEKPYRIGFRLAEELGRQRKAGKAGKDGG